MPVLHDDSDGRDQQRLRASQSDPFVMYLVVPRRPGSVAGPLLEDAAVATAECARLYSQSGAWAYAFAEWRRSSFRKICLGARPEQFERARSLPHTARGDVLCLPPRRRSAAEPALAELPAHAGGSLRPSPWPMPPPLDQAMLVLVRDDLGLTLGKACAQVGHAILIGRELHAPDAITIWERAGTPVAVRLATRAVFDRAKDALTVAVVRDAGLTQVPAGAETALASMPGTLLPGWLLDGAAGAL
jgi:peptidyl-tRNA hydrolase